MTERGKFFNLVHADARRNALRFVAEAPEGWRVTVSPQHKRRIQESRYHAMICDIAKQTTYAGKSWDAEDMKRILVDEFAEEMRLAGTPLHHDGRLIPSENGRRVIQLGIQTREFYVKEASEFIEYLFAYGADRGVVWSNEVRQALDEARRRMTAAGVSHEDLRRTVAAGSWDGQEVSGRVASKGTA